MEEIQNKINELNSEDTWELIRLVEKETNDNNALDYVTKKAAIAYSAYVRVTIEDSVIPQGFKRWLSKKNALHLTHFI